MHTPVARNLLYFWCASLQRGAAAQICARVRHLSIFSVTVKEEKPLRGSLKRGEVPPAAPHNLSPISEASHRTWICVRCTRSIAPPDCTKSPPISFFADCRARLSPWQLPCANPPPTIYTHPAPIHHLSHTAHVHAQCISSCASRPPPCSPSSPASVASPPPPNPPPALWPPLSMRPPVL